MHHRPGGLRGRALSRLLETQFEPERTRTRPTVSLFGHYFTLYFFMMTDMRARTTYLLASYLLLLYFYFRLILILLFTFYDPYDPRGADMCARTTYLLLLLLLLFTG